MIFVTVGTTMPFDELVQSVDELKGSGFFQEEIVCQIGQSTYSPVHCEHFRFEKDLTTYAEKASFLIIHGGTGSTLEALISQKPFIAFANPLSADDHQAQFLERMEREFGVIWSRDWRELPKLYEKALAQFSGTDVQPRSRLADKILNLANAGSHRERSDG